MCQPQPCLECKLFIICYCFTTQSSFLCFYPTLDAIPIYESKYEYTLCYTRGHLMKSEFGIEYIFCLKERNVRIIRTTFLYKYEYYDFTSLTQSLILGWFKCGLNVSRLANSSNKWIIPVLLYNSQWSLSYSIQILCPSHKG